MNTSKQTNLNLFYIIVTFNTIIEKFDSTGIIMKD